QAADAGKENGFDEKLQKDVPTGGADGHADADLAGPLGDADEHDVHDADAADDQRDAGDRGDHHRERADDDVEHVGDLGHVADDEIVGLTGVDVMPLGQELRDLVLGFGDQSERAGVAENGADIVELRALNALADRG